MSQCDTQHPEYAKMTDKWKRCRDTVEGQDAVHEAGVLYLPKLKDQTEDDYASYKLRAQFFNAVWRTISALSGMVFRKPALVDAPPSVEPLLEDVTMAGVDIQTFAQQATIEVLTSGRVGILVDYPQQSMDGLSLADAQALNLRPSMQQYPAETIINWKTDSIGNRSVLSLVVLTEDYSEQENEFKQKTETRYRVLDLFNGKYRVRIFRINTKKEDEQVGNDLFPLMNGSPLDYIPFYFIGIDDTTPTMDEPPVIDLVDVNLAHYRLNADYAHGLHFTGLPTAVVSGYTPENPGDKLYIGSSAAWVFPDPQARATFLEFTGQGLQAIETAIARLEQQMAILGARLLTSEKKATETAQTAQIHRAGESAILSAIAQTISTGLTKALNTFCAWAGSPGDWSITLNRDFLPAGLDPQQLTALVNAWQQGAISFDVLFNNLQQGEIIESDLTLEEMQGQIDIAPIPAPTTERQSFTKQEDVEEKDVPENDSFATDIARIEANVENRINDLRELIRTEVPKEPPVINITMSPITIETPPVNIDTPPVNIDVHIEKGKVKKMINYKDMNGNTKSAEVTEEDV